MGLELAATPPSGSQPSSVVVAGVVEGSPAEKAGVMTGDLLTGVNGNEVGNIVGRLPYFCAGKTVFSWRRRGVEPWCLFSSSVSWDIHVSSRSLAGRGDEANFFAHLF